MLPVVVMPDTELWTAGWLRAQLNDPTVYVSNAVPNPMRPKMVIVRDDGGPRVDFLHCNRVMVFNVYGPNEKAASDLASLVEGMLLSVRALDPVEYTTSLAAPVRVDDTQPRRFFTLEMIIRGTVVSYASAP